MRTIIATIIALGVTTLLLLLLGSGRVWAQTEEPKTLLDASGEKRTDFFIGPELKVHLYGPRFRTTASPLMGWKLGFIYNRQFIVGVGGWAKFGRTLFAADYPMTDRNGNVLNPNQPMSVDYFYGGVILGYVVKSNDVVHITIPVLIGGGTSNEYEIEADGDHGTTINSPGFTIVEPNLNVEVNIQRKLRLEVGTGYRFMGTGRFEQIRPGQLNGLTFQLGLKFGRY